MKPNFAYVYIAFILSLIVLTVLSFLFYQRSNSHLKYSKQFDESYNVIVQLKELEQRVIEMEDYSRGYLLTHDSSFLQSFETSRDSIEHFFTSLQHLFAKKTEQMARLQLMRSTINNQINTYSRNNKNALSMDPKDAQASVLRSKILMDTFRMETRNIEAGEIVLRNEMYENKTFYEGIYPNYFSTILVWSGIITLVSFYFIHREMGIRSRYQTELEKKGCIAVLLRKVIFHNFWSLPCKV